MNDSIWIQYRFEIQQFQDAIVLPQADYEVLSEKDIEIIKNDRFVTWQESIKNPPVIIEPTVEDQIVEITAQIDDLLQQQEFLQNQLQEGK